MVLVFAESPRGHLKKAAFEAVTYGKKVADLLGTSCTALTLGTVDQAAELGRYGASKVLNVADASFDQFDSQRFAAAIADVAKNNGAKVVIVSHTSTGKSIAGRLAVRLDAGLVSGVSGLPEVSGGQLTVKKTVFSGKAIAEYRITSPVSVLSLMGNAIKPDASGQSVAAENISTNAGSGRIRVKDVRTQEGRVPLPEAEIVVSAGRGMKDPSNWGIVEDLAETLGATTACSRPVADSDWRPHHEHVGQTGIAIRPNLYIAIGISGAIQHLAGVNNSKVIVVINKDPEAPFFKAADYGVVGDLFEVVPRLNEAFKKFKASN
ncbi:MAG: electron transfer flavoprotein subunit alpha/FixB family protein [Saprospiraceae bacterium]|nr:electron transfer flavoprotein subunit alpha/FixB family protein [Saprospiraceae bacterium]MCB0542018.1 electron transfer flavoprotein subunit alpha/FixB family protein [Saprospiraceae bacterium]MCB0573080.1 electron transfer flavoprotein subunit alpha/FixB family protein [Saprospiraceae bacterium]MCB9354974.1 electron transfer flavoprotein subunit alpha/FixB family protein [Lewinellaceae bacterium]